MRFMLECYSCGHKWASDNENENCPECAEDDLIGVDFAEGDKK